VVETSQIVERGKRPVFVVGCHRSGTNLLYDTLLSAGGFAIYRGYLPIYKMLIPRFGTLQRVENRKKIVEIWLRSKGFRRSGLEVEHLTTKLMGECKNGGDFIRIIMDEVARKQKAARWAVYDADNVVHISRIKADIPEALFVHIIRDGRDIALSLKKMGGFTPFPWNRSVRGLRETALYWEWMVRKGREYGRQIPADYFEIRYEDLVGDPRRSLAALGEFLDHDLDYDRIQSTGLGRLSDSNSSFRDEEEKVQPVNRWKEKLSRTEVAAIEAVVGECLEESGYSLITSANEKKVGIQEAWLRAVYPSFLDAKLWLKIRTPLGKLTNLSALEASGADSQPESIA
jgi:Sulfotransferase family